LNPIQEKNVDSKVSDEIKITPIQKIDSTKNKKLKNSSKPPVPPTPPTPVAAPQDAPVPAVPMRNDVGTQEDEPAQFPGGLKQIRLLIVDTFDNSKIVTPKGSNGVFQAEARILVDENGKMTNVEVRSDNEEFTKEVRRTLTKIGSENTWIPGKKDGKPVKSYYKIPVSMKFQ
jgi:protein TonB